VTVGVVGYGAVAAEVEHRCAIGCFAVGRLARERAAAATLHRVRDAAPPSLRRLPELFLDRFARRRTYHDGTIALWHSWSGSPGPFEGEFDRGSDFTIDCDRVGAAL